MGGVLSQAWGLIVSADPELVGIAWRSVRLALSSTLLAALIGVPASVALAFTRIPGRRLVMVIMNALMALPTVVVALALYGLISRRGPLGYLELLFTPGAIILGQTVLILPIVISLATASFAGADQRLRETLRTLGVGRMTGTLVIMREQSPTVVAAVLGGFGRAIGEVGVSMMLGGNIRHSTRTMTTAIALETNRGAFELAIALGMILIVLALVINGGLRWLTETPSRGQVPERRPV